MEVDLQHGPPFSLGSLLFGNPIPLKRLELHALLLPHKELSALRKGWPLRDFMELKVKVDFVSDGVVLTYPGKNERMLQIFRNAEKNVTNIL